MSGAALAEKKQLERFGNARSPLETTDPDFAETRDRLVQGEVTRHGSFNAKIQELITLVILTASQTLDGLTPHVGTALQVGATPEEVKEAIYQCAPYTGFPGTEKAFRLVNEVFGEKRIPLPVVSRKTVTGDDRLVQGVKVQRSIFGAMINAIRKNTPQSQRHLLRSMLSTFCFGDMHTRRGLDLRTREILTFCIISSLSGCEGQVKNYVQGNVNVGNTKENLTGALTCCLPHIGFPRVLNTLECANTIIPENQRGLAHFPIREARSPFRTESVPVCVRASL